MGFIVLALNTFLEIVLSSPTDHDAPDIYVLVRIDMEFAAWPEKSVVHVFAGFGPLPNYMRVLPKAVQVAEDDPEPLGDLSRGFGYLVIECLVVIGVQKIEFSTFDFNEDDVHPGASGKHDEINRAVCKRKFRETDVLVVGFCVCLAED